MNEARHINGYHKAMASAPVTLTAMLRNRKKNVSKGQMQSGQSTDQYTKKSNQITELGYFSPVLLTKAKYI